MTLIAQVQARRIARGREPVSLMHLERIVRYIAGQKPPPTRPACFIAKQVWKQRPPELRGMGIEARRAYVRAARGRAA